MADGSGDMFIDKKINLPEPDPENRFEILLVEAFLKYTMKLADAVNGGLKLNENIDCQVKSVTTAAADTEVSVAHTLKRVPTGFIVINIDKAAIVYDSGSTWTTTNIYIKCNVATVAVKLLIF